MTIFSHEKFILLLLFVHIVFGEYARFDHRQWKAIKEHSEKLQAAISKSSQELVIKELENGALLHGKIVKDQTYGIGLAATDSGVKARVLYGSHVFGKTADIALDPTKKIMSQVQILNHEALNFSRPIYTELPESVWNKISDVFSWDLALSTNGFTTPFRHPHLDHASGRMTCAAADEYCDKIEQAISTNTLGLLVPHQARCPVTPGAFVSFTIVEDGTMTTLQAAYIQEEEKILLRPAKGDPPSWIVCHNNKEQPRQDQNQDFLTEAAQASKLASKEL